MSTKRALKASRSSRVTSKALAHMKSQTSPAHVIQIRVRRVPYYGGLAPYVWRTVPGFAFERIDQAQACLARMDSTLPARIVERLV